MFIMFTSCSEMDLPCLTDVAHGRGGGAMEDDAGELPH